MFTKMLDFPIAIVKHNEKLAAAHETSPECQSLSRAHAQAAFCFEGCQDAVKREKVPRCELLVAVNPYEP